MLSLVISLMLTSPPICGQIVCPLDDSACYCAPTVLRLGSWDPRPAPADWPSNAYQSPPADFGFYPCEQQPPAHLELAP